MLSSVIVGLAMLVFQNGHEFYQQALVQERAAGNLEAAIQLFQDAARYAGNDRALAAQAMMGAARCYEKLGQAKARELYEEIARTYPDQQQQAEQAKNRAQALQAQDHESSVKGKLIFDEKLRDAAEREAAKFYGDLYQMAPGVYWKRDNVFDPTRPVTLTGRVKHVQFTNPSIFILVEAAGPDGRPATYVVKGGAPSSVRFIGFTRDTLKIGDTITVEGMREKYTDDHIVGLATITLADGRRFFLGGSVSGY